MISLQFLTLVLVVWCPCALSLDANGELRMSIVRWVENKGKDVNRVVRLLDNSQVNVEQNEAFVVHRRHSPISSHGTSEPIWSGIVEEKGTWSMDAIRTNLLKDKEKGMRRSSSFGIASQKKVLPPILTKKISTTWAWSRQHNMNYVLNMSQPVSMKVPADSPFKAGPKYYWEFKTPKSWNEADRTCKAAGLKLAQPKTHDEVVELQKVLHNRIHGRDPGCKDDSSWTKHNGYCLTLGAGFKTTTEAKAYCKSLNAMLPFPALGDITAWQEAIVTLGKEDGGTSHAGAYKAPDGQWLWEDGSVVQEESWTPEKPGGEGDCSVLFTNTGKLRDMNCSTTWKVACQDKSSSHWLGALGSMGQKCVKWSDGKCIEGEDHDHNNHIIDLWQTQPGDLISPDYALQLQIEHDRPLVLKKISDDKPFLCESDCPLGFVNYGTQCLLVKKFWLTWREANAACENIGLQLYEPEKENEFAQWLKENRQFKDTYWIGGRENRSIGKAENLTKIEKLQFICEMVHGTRTINVTDQLSYSDEQKDFKIPKFETKCNNNTVTLKERTIVETYPFSVQMDITGWIWVEYSNPTDEHGSFQCDNNNDWVGGEPCWAHSKWGYSTSYLQNGDEILAHGDNARLTLNGTVTYSYNQFEVDVNDKECMANYSNRTKRSTRESSGRRSKRSITTEKSIRNVKNKVNAVELDDSDKPLMSYIGKRAAEWARAQALERNAHLVEYHIDQLSPIVTDISLEEEHSGLMIPGSIFEEEFVNTGSKDVVTTFKKQKAISNSYRYSVMKGLNVEDSHISSYSMMDTESGSNSFSINNNIRQTEGTSKSINEGKTESWHSSKEHSQSENVGSTRTQSQTDEQSQTAGMSSEKGRHINDKSGTKVSQDVTIGNENTSGGGKRTSSSESNKKESSKSESISHGTRNSERQNTKNSNSISSSQSSYQGAFESSSDTRTSKNEKGSSKTTGGDTIGGNAGFSLFGISIGASYSHKTPTRTESTKSSESLALSSSKGSMNTQTNKRASASTSETSKSSEQETSLQNQKSNKNTFIVQHTDNNEESISYENTQKTQNTNKSERMNEITQGVNSVDKVRNDLFMGISSSNSEAASRNYENKATNANTRGRENSYDEYYSKNQDQSRDMGRAYVEDVSKGSQESLGNQKTRTQQITLDKNEEIETAVQETLDTQNEVLIPPKTKVKIEWNVNQRKVRLPWKASIVMTGWINVRFKTNNEEVCDTFHDSEYNNFTGTRWTYNYTSPCDKDNRLYGFPLSYLEDNNFIKEGNGLRFTASGIFEAIVATSHYLRVTEEAMDYDDGQDYYNVNEQISSLRRRRASRIVPTDYGLKNDDYDGYYNEQKDNRMRHTPRIVPSEYGLKNYNYDSYYVKPRVRRRVEHVPRKSPKKVTEYHLDFDEYGNGNIGQNNQHFQRFHAKKSFN